MASEIRLRRADPLQGLTEPASVHNASFTICCVDTEPLDANIPV
jgi:hypothetical protein